MGPTASLLVGSSRPPYFFAKVQKLSDSTKYFGEKVQIFAVFSLKKSQSHAFCHFVTYFVTLISICQSITLRH